MGIYQNMCYKVEDLMINVLSKKHNREIIKEKVTIYRVEKVKIAEKKRNIIKK
ncbi:hypothetical protein M3649_08595 [Ureibacillus chungkukjangi]|uniref:hypothetical protein n=1 Tax=Ureibacillus chungkukjangi TaxID=1202712 RepID=UPI002040CD97|nr:hypothetical protein [Ureibacillus chungkukjangi]MCM3388191.1 hypothetical protein [Ureibacillus chungkukjangi]